MTELERLSESNSEEELEDSIPPWIEWFLSQPQNDYFCEVDEEYILDRFNLTGLTSASAHFQLAIDRITMNDEDFFEEEQAARTEANAVGSSENKTRGEIQASSTHLYGLIHARYIITTAGLNKMYEKYRDSQFGKCPRVYCRSFTLLPVGMSDIPGQAAVQLYCAHCEDVYRPRSSRYSTVDGAYFGTSFPHIFFQQFKQCLPKKSPDHYIPKIFGFKLYTPAPVQTPPLSDQEISDVRPNSRASDIMILCNN